MTLTRRHWQAVGLLLLALVMVLVALLADSDRTAKPMLVGSDEVGMHPGMSFPDYAAHAAESFTVLTGQQPHWALVTLAEPADAETTAAIFATAALHRVSTLVTTQPPAVLVIPEPSAQATRAELIDHAFARHPERVTADTAVRSVVVFASADALRALREDPRILVVEVLPADAIYGRFAIRPVTV